MSKQQRERVIIKDDSDLFQLVKQLTSEQPSAEAWKVESQMGPVFRLELPFSILLQAVERLPTDQAGLLYHRLEGRLTRGGMPVAGQQVAVS